MSSSRTSAVIAAVLMLGTAASALAQQVEIPRLLRLPAALKGDLLYTLGTERQKLVERSQALAVATKSYNATCSEADVSKPCQDRKASTARETRDYAEAARTFNERVGIQLYVDVGRQLNFGITWGPAVPAVTRDVDSLFVGGTGWVYGYVRRDDPAQQAVARAAFENSTRVSSGTINPDDYDMIVGFAKNGSIAGDLIERVIGVPFDSDQATLGQLTSRGTGLYASLKTTRTARLDCHSNGAMVCLHALRAGDIQSSTGPNGRSTLDVRLYGPQITPAAVRAWRSLVTGGKIRSLEITFNEGDPVGPASYALGGMPYTQATVRMVTIAASLALGKVNLSSVDFFSTRATADLRTRIMQDAPGIVVKVDSIPDCLVQLNPGSLREDPLRLVACHDMRLYQARRR